MYNTMAIKAEEVPNMQNAIEDYITNVETYLSKVRDFQISSNEGIYGEKQIGIINDYIDNTCNQINSIVRYFEDFKTALTAVQEEYEKMSENVSLGEVKEAAKNEGDLITVNRMK